MSLRERLGRNLASALVAASLLCIDAYAGGH
jgi:hypothetical protein